MSDSEKKYFVMRDCCTSGNCVSCWELPVGKKVRVSQMGENPISLTLAKRVKANWRSYNPMIVMSDDNLKSFEEVKEVA